MTKRVPQIGQDSKKEPNKLQMLSLWGSLLAPVCEKFKFVWEREAPRFCHSLQGFCVVFEIWLFRRAPHLRNKCFRTVVFCFLMKKQLRGRFFATLGSFWVSLGALLVILDVSGLSLASLGEEMSPTVPQKGHFVSHWSPKGARRS